MAEDKNTNLWKLSSDYPVICDWNLGNKQATNTSLGGILPVQPKEDSAGEIIQPHEK